MFGERRKSQRHAIDRHARLQVGSGSLPRECVITDISDGGVRLHVEGLEVPDQFVLYIYDDNGKAHPRDCKVAWRLGHELGAEFMDTFEFRRKQHNVRSAGQPVSV